MKNQIILLLALLSLFGYSCTRHDNMTSSDKNMASAFEMKKNSTIEALPATALTDSALKPMVKNLRKGHSVDEDVMPVFPDNISYDFDPENVFYQDLGEVEIPEYVDDEEVDVPVDEYDDPPMQFAHKQPEFPGGPEALQKFLRSETQYPQVAKDAHAQGTVMVQFVVERDGCVSNIKILSAVFPALDQEAIRVCKSMPKWIPGENNDGKKVRVYYRMPLQFSLY